VGLLDTMRVTQVPDHWRITVAVDPTASNSADPNDTRIIVAGIGAREAYGLHPGRPLPAGCIDDWARWAIAAYHKWPADLVAAAGAMLPQRLDVLVSVTESSSMRCSLGVAVDLVGGKVHWASDRS
jgi:phage terminase large subunit-like protein